MANPLPTRGTIEVEAIDLASPDALRHTGIRILVEEARQSLKQGGMTSSEIQIVRFDGERVTEPIRHAPGSATLHARGEDRNAVIGGNSVIDSTTGGTPNSDLHTDRRPETLASLEDLCRLAHSLDVILLMGPLVEPLDLPLNLRHPATTRFETTLADEIPIVFFRGTEAVADAFEIIRSTCGFDRE